MAAPIQCGCRIAVQGQCTAALAREAVDADSTCRSGLIIPAAPSGSHPSAPDVPAPSSAPKSKPREPRHHRQAEPGIGRRIVIPIPLDRLFIGVLAHLSPAPQSPMLLSPLSGPQAPHTSSTPAPEAPTHASHVAPSPSSPAAPTQTHMRAPRVNLSLQDRVLRKLKQRAEVGV
jgi:hypothetical protein